MRGLPENPELPSGPKIRSSAGVETEHSQWLIGELERGDVSETDADLQVGTVEVDPSALHLALDTDRSACRHGEAGESRVLIGRDERFPHHELELFRRQRKHAPAG